MIKTSKLILTAFFLHSFTTITSVQSAPFGRTLLALSLQDVGLQDATSLNSSAVILGHYLVGNGVKRSTVYNGVTQFGGIKLNNGMWGQNIQYSSTAGHPPDIVETSGTYSGVTLGDANFNQQDFIWMLDYNNALIYKVTHLITYNLLSLCLKN